MRSSRSQHPGLHLLLEKLHSRVPLSDSELRRLRLQLQELQEGHDRRIPAGRPNGALPGGSDVGAGGRATATDAPEPLPGRATPEGCRRLAERSGTARTTFLRPAQSLQLSGIGIGTYRGPSDETTDARYALAVRAALTGGINVVDTSINYRDQRSERAVASALRGFIADGQGSRDEVVICTKGGFLVAGAVTPGTLDAEEVAEGVHCLAPAFLRDQIARSRTNLGVATIDVYYLHNPEIQLGSVSRAEFGRRTRAAFSALEGEVAAGRIRFYGMATWHGFRDGTLSVTELATQAREVAGDAHHLRFIQLPFNLGMREAGVRSGRSPAVLDVAADRGITVIASASLLQSRLARHLPEQFRGRFPGLTSDAQRAAQFTRSTPGVVTALVGMRDVEHVTDVLRVASVAPLSAGQYEGFLATMPR